MYSLSNQCSTCRTVLCMSKELVLDLFPMLEHSGVFTTRLVLSGKSSVSCLAVIVDYFCLGLHLDGFAWQLFSALLEDRAAWGPRHRIPSLRLLHCGESHCSLSVNLVFSSWLCDSYYYKYCWAELSPNHDKSKNIVLGVSKNLWIMVLTIWLSPYSHEYILFN